MRARFYNRETKLTLFSADITENSKGTFKTYLEASGYEYIKHRDCWVNKRLGLECIIWED
jgi:hypothetical protein